VKKKKWQSAREINKMFNEDENSKNEEKDAKIGICMFSPNNSFKSNWDTLITLILLFTCMVTPARLAFTFNDTGDKYDLDTWESINLIIDILFFIDVIFNFNSCYVDEDF